MNWNRYIVSIKSKIHFISSQCANKESQDLTCIWERIFATELTWEGSINMLKVLWCWLQQRFAQLPCCFSRDPPKLDFLDISRTTVLEAVIAKILKIYSRFQKCSTKLRKSFFLRDNFIWTGIVKLSLLRIRYFSSAANVLTSSPKIWHVNKRDVFQLNWLGSDQWIW